MRARPFSARAARSNEGTFAPVLADARRTVAIRGPQPRERITPSISMPVDDGGHVDKAVDAFPHRIPGAPHPPKRQENRGRSGQHECELHKDEQHHSAFVHDRGADGHCLNSAASSSHCGGDDVGGLDYSEQSDPDESQPMPSDQSIWTTRALREAPCTKKRTATPEHPHSSRLVASAILAACQSAPARQTSQASTSA